MNPKGSSAAKVYSGPRSYKTALNSGDSQTTATRRDSRRDTEHYLQYYQSSLADGAQHHESDQNSSPSQQGLRRQMSGGSTSPSDYSSDSKDTSSFTVDSHTDVSKARRRSGVPSDGGSDRRRLAIVQMDALSESTPNSKSSSSEIPHGENNIRTRRGLHSNLAGLALVAPPDAALKSYTQLTPPSTAPITGDTTNTPVGSVHEKGHHRSASEAVTSKKRSPRDVGIVGTGRTSPPNNVPKVAQVSVTKKTNELHPPIFQQPHSRSPSPGVVSDSSEQASNLLSPVNARPPLNSRSTEHLIVTPEIGEEKEIGTRVAAPVVINLESAKSFVRRKPSTHKVSPPTTPQIVVQQVPASAFPSTNTTSFLHYQPGVHATAGPLPPPPRAMFNIDTNSPAPPRPPRLNSPHSGRPRGDIEAVKQALQLPASVSAALASRSITIKSSPSPKPNVALNGDSDGDTTKTTNSEINRVKSIHRREGAFTPSTNNASDSDAGASQTSSSPRATSPDDSGKEPRIVDDTEPVIDDTTATETDNLGPPITIIQPLKRVMEDDSTEKTEDVNSELDTTPQRRRSDDISTGSSRSRSPSNMSHTGETPSPPPKSFRHSLTRGLKRLSTLPRTPSISSRSARRSSGGTHYSARTPSPSMLNYPPSRMKIKSAYPSAMYCTEVFSRNTSLERCVIYANKINELYMYDCGLSDWMTETKLRANTNRPVFPANAQLFTPQPRHTSRASMISEATFPRRPDATSATDLTVKTRDLVPTAPPALPYPSLAQTQRLYPPRSSSSATSGTPPSSIRSLAPSTPSTKTGGFFASLGRKASLSSTKREKGGLPSPAAPSSPGTRLLTKNPPANPAPRQINISNTPSVPGGPRAPPNRVLRSQTIMTTTNPFASNSPTSDNHDPLTRRPSLFNLSQESPVMDIQADPEFVRQVDKLVDLLPHAERDVLAGYLRRAGQDILAIGQYLEDEKNGTIKI